MITQRRPPENIRPPEEDEDPPRIPFFKRRGVLVLLAGGAMLTAVILVAQTGFQAQVPKAVPGSYIGVAAPVEPAPAPPPVLPAVVRAPPPPALPDLPPVAPNIGAVLPDKTKTEAPDRPVMLTYAVPARKEPVAAAPKPAEPKEPTQTGIKFDATSIAGMKASPSLDTSLMLMPGLLPCVLDTAIDSNLPGPLLCHLPGPVYSDKGVLLMEASTKIIGSYESFSQNGVERLKADTAFAWTPHGVMVPLTEQPLADGLGRVGLSGELDHRYFERFAGAILLDIAKSGLSIIQSEVSKGGSTYLSLNSSDSLARDILQSSVNLPPIFKKNQGSMIAIWLKKPVSFAESYRVR